MKKAGILNLIIGVGLLLFAVYHHYTGLHIWAVVKDIIGCALVYIYFRPGRTSMLVFGHAAIVAGGMLFAGGIYLAPFATEAIRQNGGQITLGILFGMPLFWSVISIGGGVCAIYHGFCRCITHKGCNKQT